MNTRLKQGHATEKSTMQSRKLNQDNITKKT